jgi:hypothetical protein
MPFICYQEKRFSTASKIMIDQANEIIDEYSKQGYDLTLRQLYYQFVSRDLLVNKDSEYKRLGSVVADARLAGLINWNAITDRTRNLRSNSHWDSAQDIIQTCVNSFALDKWADQNYRVEVWVEKDALIGVIESACEPLDVPYFSCRGYTSLSEVWSASQRLIEYEKGGQSVCVIHLGDHDPSGIDMSRDIEERLVNFDVRNLTFKRIALNMDQVEQYEPPPNPAKVTDTRFTEYQKIHGDESWELDALDPSTLSNLITDEIVSIRDEDEWNDACEREQKIKDTISKVARDWDKITKKLKD